MQKRSFAMACLCIGLLCAAVISGAIIVDRRTPEAPPAQPEAPKDVTTPVKTGVFVGGRLWLLGLNNDLWSVGPGIHTARAEVAPTRGFITGLCAQDGALIEAAIVQEPDEAVHISKWIAGRWSEIATVSTKGERELGLICGPGGPLLMTDRRLVTLSGSRPDLPLKGPVIDPKFGPVDVKLLLTDSSVFVGLDIGEWGGGLRQIDRSSGRVVVREKKDTGATCDVPLDTKCDAVTGLVMAPWDPKVVVATVGQRHMSDHGRVVTIGPDWIQSVHYGPCPEGNFIIDGCSEPFLGLVRSGRRVLAISPQGLTSLGPGAPAIRVPLSNFERYGPFEISFSNPDVVLLRRVYNNGSKLVSDFALAVSR